MNTDCFGVSGVGWSVPTNNTSLNELEKSGLLVSSASDLREFGFDQVRRAEGADIYPYLLEAASMALTDAKVDPMEVDYLIVSSAIELQSNSVEAADPLSLFRYTSTRLQQDIGLLRANSVGLHQAGCTSFLAAWQHARGLMLADTTINKVLCIGGDAFPIISKREIMHNAMSDGGAAVVISRGATSNRLGAYHQITKSFYWDARKNQSQVLATYFPTALTTIRQVVAKAGLTLDDIDLIIPHNVSLKSWQIIAQMLKYPEDKIWLENIQSFGHTTQADICINLASARESGRIQPNSNVLVFSFGFGAHWAAAVLSNVV